MDEKFLSSILPDEWEEYRPREINFDTLTIWLGHKNRYPPLLALTPDDPNFSEDISNPQTAKYDYRADLQITEYPNGQIAKQSLDNYHHTSEQPQQVIAPDTLLSSSLFLTESKKILRNMGCATAKGEFLGENAIFFINQNKEKICLATQINDFVLTGDIFNYSALPAANTPIHSAICEVTRRNHSRIIHYCKCQYCRPHSPCSTIEKEGLIYPEKVHSLLEYIFSEFKKQLPSKNPTQIAEYLVGKPYSKYDCSKTTQTIYPFLPRTAQEQYNYFEKRAAIIPLRYDLKEGDLIFFKDNTDAIKHVGYIVTNKNGNIEFIDSTFKKGVKPAYMNTDGREGSKNMYGEWHFAGGGRP